MDTLNDGQWNFTGNGKYRAEFAVKEAGGTMNAIAAFDGEGDLLLAADADTRYSRRLRTQEQVLFDLMAKVKKEPLRGRIPTKTLIYGYTFKPGLNPKYDAAAREFRKMFGLQDTQNGDGTYIDVRGVPTPKLADYCKNLGARAKRIRCVSLGDEIGLPKPRGKTVNADFVVWLKSRGLKPKDVLPKTQQLEHHHLQSRRCHQGHPARHILLVTTLSKPLRHPGHQATHGYSTQAPTQCRHWRELLATLSDGASLPRRGAQVGNHLS